MRSGDFTQLLLFAFAFLFFTFIHLFLRLEPCVGLHVLEAGLVVVRIRISVLVILRDGLELLLTQLAVESLQSGRYLRFQRRFAGNGILNM